MALKPTRSDDSIEIIFAEDALLYEYDFLDEHVREDLILEFPEVPFCRKLADPLTPNSSIIIYGSVHKDAIRFAVNLGHSAIHETAFHFNPRFDQNYVARNSKIGYQWGVEEAHSIRRNPFRRGDRFVIEIFITKECFLVSVDGLHFCSYAHRIPPSTIKTFEIEGDVTLEKVELTTKDHYPSILPSIECKLSNLSSSTEAPVMYKLKEGLGCGQQVAIKGRVKLLPISFYVNLQGGCLYWPHPEIGFHLSVRFDQGVMILNSWEERGGWGSEEMLPLSSRLSPGSNFSLDVLHSQGGFVVSLDKSLIANYKRRVQPSSVDTLYIQGDVLIYSIRSS